jgi:hypothetical protein
MSEPIAANEAILTAYCGLMEELKARHAIVHKILNEAKAKKFVLSPYILGELCFLQLRMMCELIALGCLLVHGDVPATRTTRMQKAYAADWIINRLTELQPSFYPLPGVQRVDEVGKVITVEPNPRPHLTKTDLLELYAECGGILHRGTLRSVLAADTKHIDFVRVAAWTAKIAQLLDHHQIPLADERYQVWVIMHAKTDKKVHAVVMQRAEDSAAIPPHNKTPPHS